MHIIMHIEKASKNYRRILHANETKIVFKYSLATTYYVWRSFCTTGCSFQCDFFEHRANVDIY